MFLRAHDRAFAGKFDAALFRRIHQCRNRAPRLAGNAGIDAVHAEHHGRIEHVAARVALFERRAGKGGEVAVARTVDEDAAANGAAAGFGFDEQRLDSAFAFHDDAGGERMEKYFDAARQQQIVGRAFIGGGVIGLRE